MSAVFATAVRRNIALSFVLLISVMAALGVSAPRVTFPVHFSHPASMLLIDPDGSGHAVTVTRALSGRTPGRARADISSARAY
jgi:hypothetical protein